VDFLRVKEAGRSWHHAAFVMSAVLNGLAHNRYGFIVSKRLGKAVVRNRLRRRLREAVRSIHPQIQPGYDVVVVARVPSLSLSYWELRQALVEVMQRAGLLETSP
jgi:ribonuclease P protein component